MKIYKSLLLRTVQHSISNRYMKMTAIDRTKVVNIKNNTLILAAHYCLKKAFSNFSLYHTLPLTSPFKVGAHIERSTILSHTYRV